MQANFTVAVTGDSILNRRISVYSEDRFLSLVKILRDADVAYTNLETLIHDYDGPELYPSAEGAFYYMRSPRFVADELKWAGFDMISTAGNHSLDYSYGGLFSTWKALDEAGLVHAGTGIDLAKAREPAYLDTANGRVALISMCSSFAKWARAGEVRRDAKGRPGLNPLRFYYKVDAKTLEIIKQLTFKLGWDVTEAGKTWLFFPAGTAMSYFRFEESDEPGITPVADEDDVEGNLQSIRDARRHADYVLVHLHNHEEDPDKGLDTPAKFVPLFARTCIDAGADVFIGQGSHAPLRGIEVYKNKPIFYDPGDIFGTSSTITRFPADFYWRPGYDPEIRKWDATPTDAINIRQRALLHRPFVPPPVEGAIVGICSFQAGGLTEFKFYPVTLVTQHQTDSKFPILADAETAKKITERVAQLSVPFGTKIKFKDGMGVVKL
jgi:poly-gamma-glutamate synthesis protein (capsule biosynthesis protein)